MGFVKWYTFVLVFTLVLHSASSMSEYRYARYRDHLYAQEKNFEGNTINLGEDEIVVDNYMEYLKWVEFERTRDAFPPSRPIEQVLDTIKESEIYRVLRSFPKGGNLQASINQILSKRKMLDTIFDSEMLQFLCVNTYNDVIWKLNFYDTPPAGWEKVTDNTTKYTKEAISKHVNYIDVISDTARAYPTDTDIRYLETTPLFHACGYYLVSFANYTSFYFQSLFKAALEENVQYIEARSSPYKIFYVDDSAPRGRVYLGGDDGELWYTKVREALREFQQDNPEFIGYREILNGKRYRPAENFKVEMDRAISIQQTYPDIIGGFDLTGSEDRGFSLLHVIDAFDEDFHQSNLSLFFHAAQTKWPNDLLTSTRPEDPVSALDNAYEAIILGSKRIGDGLGVVKHPYLMQLLKERGIAVEFNPVSNMLMGFVPDQRNHPAITLLRYGVPVVIGADYAGTLGYDEFTIDWYQAYMSWGLNLADLKQLALNSLSYSTMTQEEKSRSLRKWYLSWNSFVANTKTEACSANFTAPTPEMYRIYPADGPAIVSTNVRVFGRQFQSAICQTIKCKFGSDETEGRYVYNHMITCPTPGNQNAETVPFSISFDSGISFIPTDLNYTYNPMPIPELL